MNKHLFIFTITPVQSFIAQSRKTQDLYGGSQILSDLTKEAIKQLPAKNGLILPDPSMPFSPNRFIAEVETDNIKNFSKRIEDCVKQKLIEFADEALKVAKNCNTLSSEFCEQIKSLFQVFWAALPYTTEDYTNNFKILG